ncbi:MAG: TIGR02444 family protein [Gammaproteobacteria bacterium]|nr:TIGR02444 family protein [Gammaproteobacteria bacterium]
MSNENDFWNFTLAAYPAEGVQQSVIYLQDNCGADVNLLFYCCWAGSRGGQLSEDDLKQADAAVNTWREQVTKPLRAIRDNIKDREELSKPEGAMDVRGKILGAEIDSERIAQGILESQLPDDQETTDNDPYQLATHNLRRYFKNLSQDISGKNLDAIVNLLRGAFPDEFREQIKAALAN